LTELVIEALIARPVFAKAGHVLFHGDPHAGNLFFTGDGRLALLDWSLVGVLGERERTAIVQVLLGALTLDAGRIVATLMDLPHRGDVDRAVLESVVHACLRQVRRGQFPGFTWLLGLLDQSAVAARLRVGADLLLFRKTLHTLAGVLADIGAGSCRMDEVLLREFLIHLALEWPQRWLAPPTSRAFATRLSNADLAQGILSLPWAAAQFWLEQLCPPPWP
jgi:ubiquinone biosynthesis protein